MRLIDRRKETYEEARLSTQRLVTYALLLIFTAVAAAVFKDSNDAERSTVLQTVINFTMIAVGYWLGSSTKQPDTPRPVTPPLAEESNSKSTTVTTETKHKESLP